MAARLNYLFATIRRADDARYSVDEAVRWINAHRSSTTRERVAALLDPSSDSPRACDLAALAEFFCVPSPSLLILSRLLSTDPTRMDLSSNASTAIARAQFRSAFTIYSRPSLTVQVDRTPPPRSPAGLTTTAARSPVFT